MAQDNAAKTWFNGLQKDSYADDLRYAANQLEKAESIEEIQDVLDGIEEIKGEIERLIKED